MIVSIFVLLDCGSVLCTGLSNILEHTFSQSVAERAAHKGTNNLWAGHLRLLTWSIRNSFGLYCRWPGCYVIGVVVGLFSAWWAEVSTGH